MRGSPGIRHPLLEAAGVAHAFGVAPSGSPAGLVRPRQVHGAAVALIRDGCACPEQADAIVARAAADRGPPVGVVTADCVPILACGPDGRVVCAIHAGWRGLASGVIEQGIRCLGEQLQDPRGVRAVIGPHIGVCCYEVDAAVLGPLQSRFGAGALEAATVESRPGHHRLSLAHLSMIDLERSGIRSERRARVEDSCTFCDPRRFESYRRDGERAERMLHYIAPT